MPSVVVLVRGRGVSGCPFPLRDRRRQGGYPRFQRPHPTHQTAPQACAPGRSAPIPSSGASATRAPSGRVPQAVRPSVPGLKIAQTLRRLLAPRGCPGGNGCSSATPLLTGNGLLVQSGRGGASARPPCRAESRERGAADPVRLHGERRAGPTCSWAGGATSTGLGPRRGPTPDRQALRWGGRALRRRAVRVPDSAQAAFPRPLGARTVGHGGDSCLRCRKALRFSCLRFSLARDITVIALPWRGAGRPDAGG